MLAKEKEKLCREMGEKKVFTGFKEKCINNGAIKTQEIKYLFPLSPNTQVMLQINLCEMTLRNCVVIKQLLGKGNQKGYYNQKAASVPMQPWASGGCRAPMQLHALGIVALDHVQT